ncbi:glycosyltransferase 87 family protein [Actinokineospora globicatena]|uniref:glycosyltransferase 87 family protein n=1 Tax=Actinokineospora globicatena TaxID=103729 RepID=UPI0020A3A2DF|nr:glycosyltransferase 87 family protein [Actinokineospora globicatena]
MVGLVSQPVLLNATIGQVNMLLVLGDVAGIGIGLAAGIKLVPGIFVVYLLITRQFRAAAIAVGTFLATIAVGFAGLPRDSRSRPSSPPRPCGPRGARTATAATCSP